MDLAKKSSSARGPCIPRHRISGNYAVKIIFSDGHNSGIYSWDYLIDLATNFEQNWNDYLRKLAEEKRSRDPVFIDAISD